MRKCALLVLAVVFGWCSGAAAGVIELQWANTVSNVSHANFFGDPQNATGAPDGVTAGFEDVGSGNPSALESATYSGFGSGDVTTLPTEDLATFLGVSDLILTSADLLAFESNGISGMSFETADWEFSDGENSVVVSHVVNTPPSGAVVALGNVTVSAYEGFFNLGQYPPISGDWAFVLFDIDGNSSVNPYDNNFSVRIFTDGVAVNATPDPDALARLVPEPTTALLLTLGLAGLAMRRRG